MVYLAGCGGQWSAPPPGSSAADPAFSSAVPAYSSAAIEMESSDAAAPNALLVGSGTLNTDPDDACHPHLFVRTHEVVARLNLHTAILLSLIRDVASTNPTLKSATSHVWENVRNGIVRKLTLTKEADGLTYDFALEVAVVPLSGDPDFVTVASGKAASNGATPNEETGSMTFDFSALKSVVTTEAASGQFTVEFDVVKGTSKKLVFHFTDFLPRGDDPHGPRTGSFVHYGKSGVGGSLKYQYTVVLLCPANPSALTADLDTVGEWYLNSTDGTLHGRADARAVGGQIASGDVWEGVTCSQGAAISDDAEHYWMMKVEDANGATLGGSAVAASQVGAASCDPAFINGSSTTPALDNNSSDFAFTAYFNDDGSVKDETPFLFPAIQ
jgi:hypothetical protein